MNNIWKILKEVKEFKLQMLFAALLGSATIGSSIGLMMTSAYLISAAALHPSISELAIAIVGVRFFGVVRGVFRYFERLITHRVTFDISARLRVWFYESVEPTAPAGLVDKKSGDLLKRIVCDVESIELIFSKLIAPVLIACFISIITAVVMFFFNPTIAIISFTGLFISGVILPLLSMIIGRNLCKNISVCQGDVSNLALDYAQGMPELVAYGLVEQHKLRMNKAVHDLIQMQYRNSKVVILFENAVTMVMYITVAVLMVAVIPLVSNGTIGGVLVACVLLGTMAAFEAVMPLTAATHNIELANRAAGELLDILEARSDSTGRFPEKIDHIHINDICFKYDEYNDNVLENFNFRVARGEAVFVAGVSGAGKSTLINIIFKFWLPQRGSVYLGAIDLSEIAQADISKYISALGQNTYLFNGTIRENMLIADNNASDKSIMHALGRAALLEFVESLPNGLDTHVGEHGTSLSSGEQRRLALARTLLRNTPFVIFDEPTAGLDTDTAARVMNTLLSLKYDGKGVVIITHDQSFISEADRLYSL